MIIAGNIDLSVTANLTRWCWGWLGRSVRVVLPSCAIKKIRDSFPSETYSGFKYPTL